MPESKKNADISDGSSVKTEISIPTKPPGIQIASLGAAKLLPEWIYEQLMEQIASGRLARGDRLPSENALAEMFGVSRPTVRNALFRLQSDGILRSRKGSGNYVAEAPSPHILSLKPGKGNISEMMLGLEFRLAIEGDAAALAATRRSDVELAQLKGIMQQQEQLSGAPVAESHDADILFHTLIADAARNRHYSVAIRNLYSSVINSWLLWHRAASNTYGQIWNSVLDEHRAVYEAIRDGDADGARAAMRIHINNGRRRVLYTNDKH